MPLRSKTYLEKLSGPTRESIASSLKSITIIIQLIDKHNQKNKIGIKLKNKINRKREKIKENSQELKQEEASQTPRWDVRKNRIIHVT